MENQPICQSCGMPLTEEFFGTNADGSKTQEYCIWCYKDGAFMEETTMEGMIDHCIRFLGEFNGASDTKLTEQEAREQMRQFFPTLKRWKK